MKLEIENLTQFPIPTLDLEKIASGLTDRDIDLVICNNAFIRELNMKHRRKTDSTDVLSFPIRGIEGNSSQLPLGSIVISIDKVNAAASEFMHSPREELLLLFIHGLLHLLGNDHARDNGEMRQKEELLITHYQLPTSLIVRTEDI